MTTPAQARVAAYESWARTPAAVVRDRIYARLEACAELQCRCLLWTGAKDRAGYGQIRIDRRLYVVHRVAWQLDNGPIPDGLTIDHVRARGCRHVNCANVAHLEPVTMRVNLLRGTSPFAINAAKDRCDNGHEFDLFNTYFYASGGRKCRACRREQERARYRRMRAA